MSILIENGTIVTMDPQRRVFERGALFVEGDRIVALGDPASVRRIAGSPEHRIDAANCVILPGLIDTHVHTANTLSRGTADPDLAIHDWLTHAIHPFKTLLNQQDGKLSAQVCILEMLRTGTTCFLDTLFFSRYGFDGLAEAVVDSGIRACLAKYVIDIRGPDATRQERPEDSAAEARAIFSKHHGSGNGRIEVWLEPPPLRGNERSIYEEVSTLARQLNTGVTAHFLETREDLQAFLKSGPSPARFLIDVGMAGEKRVLAHGVWIPDGDFEVLAKGGFSIAHCPTTNMKLVDGIAPVAKMRRNGVTVGLGCDGFGSNDNVDIFREMRTAALLQKVASTDPLALRTLDALQMGTINGAQALGKAAEIGSLEIGKKADLLVINMKRPYTNARQNPLAHLVYACSGSDVRDVIIDGQIILSDRRILTMDEEAIYQEAEKRAGDVIAAFSHQGSQASPPHTHGDQGASP